MDRRVARGAETWQVVVGGAVVGEVVLHPPRGEDDELGVLAAGLADDAHAPTLLALLDCRALELGAASIALEVRVGETGSALGAIVAAGAFEEVARRMRLDLTGDLPPETSVRLEPMGAEAWAGFAKTLADGYVEERARSGESPARAREVMRTQLAVLLPDGPDTLEQHLFTAWADDVVVAHLWLGTERPGAFVYDIDVVEEQRRRGWGRTVMRAAALWARAEGKEHLGLNVFSHNVAAGALYESLGYATVETSLRRVVAG